jgi:gamma-glutamyltranspeptidase/glutathione hydrolase
LTYSQILDLDSPEQQRDPAGDSAGDTAYVAVIDGAGVACSLINSLYQEFGSGAVVPGTGIALHNRGALFSLERVSQRRRSKSSPSPIAASDS